MPGAYGDGMRPANFAITAVLVLAACSDDAPPDDLVAFWRGAGEVAGTMCIPADEVAVAEFEGVDQRLVDVWWEGWAAASKTAGC